MRVNNELRLSLSVTAIVFLLFGFFSYAQQQDTAKSSVPVLSDVEKRFRPRPKETPKQVPTDLPGVEKRFLQREELSPLTSPNLPGVEKKRFQSPQAGPFDVPQLPEVGWPEVREFKDFKGGLDLSTVKTKVPPNRAIVLKNALWNEQGEMYMRPEHDTLVTTPEEFNFVYRYYQQDGDKYLMGGSDTALYFRQEDSTSWTYLAGTEGTSGRWDGTTFEDMFVATHEGIVPLLWNGVSFETMGTLVDSFQVIPPYWAGWDTSGCDVCSSKVSFDPLETGWTANEWVGYTLSFWARLGPKVDIEDTVLAKALILSNTAAEIYVRHQPGLSGFSLPSWHGDGGDFYARIHSWFDYELWREGTVDSVFNVATAASDAAWLCDSAYVWDSTFAYSDYVFEVVGGTGDGKKTFLTTYNQQIRDRILEWSTTRFVVPTFGGFCFDTTTEYKIYKPRFWKGSKFVENYDGRIWFGWTGTGENQNKNRLIYSALSDLGNWPSENNIYLTPGDGDYITGMISLSDARYVDVPSHLLMVTKNASSYKIVPTSTAGVYDSWYISTRYGCVSNSAMAVGEGLVLFPDQSGVWAWDQRNRPQSISLLIDPIFEAWDISNLEYASAVYNPQDRHYYLSYPGAADDSSIFLVWQDNRTDGELYEVYAQRYSSGLDTLNVNFAVNDDSPAGSVAHQYPSIDMNAYGYSVVVWMDDRDGDAGAGHVYGQRYDNAGQMQSGNFRVSGEWSAYGQWPSVAMMSDNSFMVVWTDYRCACEAEGYQDTCPEPPTCPAEDHINENRTYAQAYSSSGVPVGANFQVIDTDYPTTSVGEETDIASNYYGSYVAVWEDGRDANGVDIYGQRLTSAGRLGANFKISDYDGANALSDPRVAMARDGRFVVCWHDQRDGNHAYCQMYDSSATKVGSNFRADSVGGDGAAMSDVGMNPATGDFVVTWIYGSGSPNYFTYPMAQRYLADGSENGDSIWISTIASGGVENVRVVMDEDDEFAVSWLLGAGNYNVYLQCYCSDGSKHGDAIVVSEVAGLKAAPELAGKFDCTATSTMNTLAYNIDYHGWSRQSFSASAYVYQHGLTDTVKVLFAEDGTNTIQNYNVQADDEDDPVILTYQSPYLPFVQNPSWEAVMSYATLEAFLDTGEVYVYWYKDYSELVHVDTIICGPNCREEMQLPSDIAGHNISMKIITGSEIEDFTLSGYWWEYLIIQWRN